MSAIEQYTLKRKHDQDNELNAPLVKLLLYLLNRDMEQKVLEDRVNIIHQDVSAHQSLLTSVDDDLNEVRSTLEEQLKRLNRIVEREE